MKLYTEEQLKQAVINGCEFIWDDKEEFTQGINKIVNEFRPIELPSDEEIDKQAHKVHNPQLNEFYSYKDGAEWMREQILNQNK